MFALLVGTGTHDLIAELLVLNTCPRACGAGYQHGDRQGCLTGTREALLDEVESWTKDFYESPVYWLNGLAGTGKSTIAQTTAERLFADGRLGASFFCSRDFKDRSSLHLIFPTLSFQLAHRYPDFRSTLIPLLQSNPDIGHESLCSQMERLIVNPLKKTDISTVVVIDALDECIDDEPQSAILSVMGRFVEEIPNVKFFITGRPEPHIQSGFRLKLLRPLTEVFTLHMVEDSIVNIDIRRFLQTRLSELAQQFQLSEWPSDKHIDLLCQRAAGLFVYAAATIRFLDHKIYPPQQQLDAIVTLPECTVYEGGARLKANTTLDSLYTSILQVALDFGAEDPKGDSRVRSTIGAVVLVVNPLPPSAISELIGLESGQVMMILTLVQSLLILSEDPACPVKPFHKSFPDFITDPSRCLDKRFYIFPGNLHYELTMNCLRLMNDTLEYNFLSLPNYALNREVKDLPDRVKNHISSALEYACKCWYSHLTRTRENIPHILDALHVFMKEKFLAWLEVISVLGAVRNAVVAMENLMQWLQEVCFWPTSKCRMLLMAHIRWLQTRSSSTLPETIFILSPSFLRSLRFQPPTSTTLHWNYLPNHQLSESTTIASSSRIPNQGWYMGLPAHGTSLQSLIIIMDHILGHLVVNSFQHAHQILWKSGMLLLLKNAQTSKLLHHTLTPNKGCITTHQMCLPIHQMVVP